MGLRPASQPPIVVLVNTAETFRVSTLARSANATVVPPFILETNLPGVFAVGDVRSTSVKRVASAVGEGSICVQLVHRVLAE